MWMPQARITWRNRNDFGKLAGVSETTQWLSMMNYFLWGVFGVLSSSFWVLVPSLISFPPSLATIVVIRRGRRLAFRPPVKPARTSAVPAEPRQVIPITAAHHVIPMTGSMSAVA